MMVVNDVIVIVIGVNDVLILVDVFVFVDEDGVFVDVDFVVFGGDVDSDDDGFMLIYFVIGILSEGSVFILGIILIFDSGIDF